MSNQDKPKALSDERHPLDESLGNIHELALRCAMIGQHDLGMILAKAHETIQQWVIQNESGAAELHELRELRKDKARLLEALNILFEDYAKSEGCYCGQIVGGTHDGYPMHICGFCKASAAMEAK